MWTCPDFQRLQWTARKRRRKMKTWRGLQTLFWAVTWSESVWRKTQWTATMTTLVSPSPCCLYLTVTLPVKENFSCLSVISRWATNFVSIKYTWLWRNKALVQSVPACHTWGGLSVAIFRRSTRETQPSETPFIIQRAQWDTQTSLPQKDPSQWSLNSSALPACILKQAIRADLISGTQWGLEGEGDHIREPGGVVKAQPAARLLEAGGPGEPRLSTSSYRVWKIMNTIIPTCSLLHYTSSTSVRSGCVTKTPYKGSFDQSKGLKVGFQVYIFSRSFVCPLPC